MAARHSVQLSIPRGGERHTKKVFELRQKYLNRNSSNRTKALSTLLRRFGPGSRPSVRRRPSSNLSHPRNTATARVSTPGSETNSTTVSLLFAAGGPNPDRVMTAALQHRPHSQRPRIPAASAGEHRHHRPKADHALRIKSAHSMGISRLHRHFILILNRQLLT